MALLTIQEQGQSWKAAFSGSNRQVQAYFIEEVLKLQSAEMQTFLLSTALLESFSSSLCNAAKQKLVDDVAWIPLYQDETQVLVNPKLQNYPLHALGIIEPDAWGNIYMAAQ